MLIYYVMLFIGVILVAVSIFLFIFMYNEKDFSFSNVAKSLGGFLVGVLILVFTLPSLKYIVLKEYDVVTGKCVIEIDSSGRSSEADFTMLETDEMFTFRDIPALNAYGKAIPYYCKVTVTKDHKFEIAYKIYDAKTRKFIVSSE
jgi:hypothetical protein